MLQAINLTKQFGSNQALANVNLNVSSGEIYCLLGANGAGKTTLINLFLGFLEPTKGEVRINNNSVIERPLVCKKDIAYIPEQVMLYGVLSGLENLEYFAALATGKKLPKDQLLHLLEEAGLDAKWAGKKVSTYSKGMRQKVGIAIAMAKQAKAFLLDEPTSGLDPKAANEFSHLITKARQNGVAILMATHDLFHAKQTGTRIGIMREGKLRTEINANDISHGDLEALYLEHMRA